MLDQLRNILADAYSGLLSKDRTEVLKLLERPKSDGHGHLALPVFAWSKALKIAPPVLAQQLAQQMSQEKPIGLESVQPVSGFLNFTFETSFVQELLAQQVLGRSGKVGHSDIGRGKKMLIDF